MYIVPQSNFRLIHDVPFNSDYRDTIYFRTQAAQETYFTSKIKRTFSDFTYVRQSGAVRVPALADDLFDCNYCMFKNTGFGNKWFYGFITSIDYINNDVTEITFEIDIFQTWLFDFSLGYCYIEREHVADDTIGKHTLDENLPVGELTTDIKAAYLSLNPIIVLNVLETASNGQIINGVYSPTKAYIAPDAVTLNGILTAYDTEPEKIASLTMAFPETNITQSVSGLVSFDDYTPKNNKLFVYPYNFLSVGDYGSNEQIYHIEDFANVNAIEFRIRCGTGENTGAPYGMVVPLAYKGIAAGNTAFALVKTDFPSCAYSIDNFRAWQAFQGQQAANNLQTMIENTAIANESAYVNALVSGVGGAVGAVASGNIAAAGQGLTNFAMSQYNVNQQFKQSLNSIENASQNFALERKMHAVHGVSMGGTLGSATANWQAGNRGFVFKQHHVKPEYARVIDDFFTRFGYKVLRFDIPNVTSRANFNYIKTIECEIRGNVPNYANVGLQKIFNSGITLWHKTDIGNYNTNPIV